MEKTFYIEEDVRYVNRMEKRICCICGKEIKGWGNNPYPVKENGECCDECNTKYVIPARFDELLKGDK